MAPVRRIETVVVGGGQAGLAMSRCLSARGIGHVVLERGRVAERWRSERWDSLTLLTPNWQSRLPAFSYAGPDPDGFMTMPAVIEYLERYARSFSAPVECDTSVLEVAATAGGFRVDSTSGVWQASTLVIATGHCDVPYVPPSARELPRGLFQITPGRYRHPGQLPPGGVLVVGASASGLQLAEEIHLSGRPVTLAAGAHTRVPRTYRGRDIMWWLDRAGVLHETRDQVYDVDISRDQPSLQLVGRPDHATLDLRILQEKGVRVVGRLIDIDSYRVRLADDLIRTTVAADVKLAGLLQRLDQFAERSGIGEAVDPPTPFTPIWPVFAEAPSTIDLRVEGIQSVVWATGYRREYPWLKVPVLDGRGEIRHSGGVTDHPGLYVIGLHFLRTRHSNFIDGVGADAFALSGHLANHLKARRRAIAPGLRPIPANSQSTCSISYG